MKALKILGAAAATAVLTFSVGLVANAAPDNSAVISSIVRDEYETPIIPVNALTVNAECDQDNCYEGEPFTIKLTPGGGSGSYSYSYSVTDSNGKTISSTKSEEPSLVLSLRQGTYTVSAQVNDDFESSAVATLNITVKKREPLQDNGTKLSKNITAPGEKLTVTASFKGGKEPYTYQYTYYNKFSGSSKSSDFLSKNKCTYTMPNSAGYYSFSVTAKDALGKTKTVSMDAAVVQNTGKTLSLYGSSIDKTTVAAGGSITTTAAASGGTAPYKFHISYMGPDGKWIYTDKDYIYGITRKFNLPKVSGKYVVRIAVKDHAGKYVEKRFNVEIPAFSVNNSQISASSVDLNKPVTLTAKIQNNVGSVKYHYSYHYEGKPWKYTGDYVSSNTQKFSFSTPGTVYVRVGAKDSLGTYKEKQFRVIVKKPKPMDVSGSSVSNNIVAAGSKFRLNSKVSDANGQVKYHYSYHPEGKKWIYLGDYTTSSVKDFCFKWNNVYYVRVGVKDASGQYKEKQFKIYVYSKNTKKTIAQTTLQNSANWKSSSALTLKSGSVVNPVRTDGRWFLVKYNNRTGYVYNLAFGGSRNYSSISTSTLPVIADDIIYSNGKNIYNLYNYVNSMGYVSIKNDSLENLCVHILKYHRGACYHRAALLYYLLDRAGFEVVRVNDGIDNYTGGDPHNWCIIKTAQGWRHIDPTPIIGVKPIYLETDTRVATLFSWNRNKYPKCN